MKTLGITQSVCPQCRSIVPARVEAAFRHLDGILSDCDKLLTRNRIFYDRLSGVGVLPADEAVSYGVTGPMLRAAGVDYDVRKAEPYSGYDGVIFSAQSHGLRHGVRYLEIEINNQLLQSDDEARGVAERLATPILALLAAERGASATMEQKCGLF